MELDVIDIDDSLQSINGKSVVLTGKLKAIGGIEKLQIAAAAPGSSNEGGWIGRITIMVDFAGEMTLTGGGSSPKGLTLGKLSRQVTLLNSKLFVSGNVGSLKVGTVGAGSTLAVGVDSGQCGQFFTDDDGTIDAWLGRTKYKNYETNKNGEKFGIIAGEFLKHKTLLPFDEGDFYIRKE